jgi:hypothetical protein
MRKINRALRLLSLANASATTMLSNASITARSSSVTSTQVDERIVAAVDCALVVSPYCLINIVVRCIVGDGCVSICVAALDVLALGLSFSSTTIRALVLFRAFR